MANVVQIVVTGVNRTGNLFGAIRRNMLTELRKLHTPGKYEGKALGTRIALGISDGIKGAGKNIGSAFTNTLRQGISGTLTTPVIGPIILTAMLGAVTAAAPIVGAAIGGGLMLGFGAGMAGLGAMVLTSTETISEKWSDAEQKAAAKANEMGEKVSKQIRGVMRGLKVEMQEAFKPLLPVMAFVGDTMKRLSKEFSPVIESMMKISQGPMKDFIKNLGDAFLELKPAMIPMMEAFNTILGAIGPQLPGAFQSISDSLIQLAMTCVENKDLIAAVFIGLLAIIPPVLDTIGGSIRFFRSMMQFMADGFSAAASTALDWATAVLYAMQIVTGALALIPGPMQDTFALANAAIGAAIKKVDGWKASVEAMPKILKLQMDLSQFSGKLESARRQLKDPNLTSTKKAKLRAEIAQLLNAIAHAKGAIASLRGKTVDVVVRYSSTGRSTINGVASVGAHDRRHGGISGGGLRKFAHGGISGASGTSALVGEEGPEVVNLPFGSTVSPANATRNRLRDGFGAVSMAFKGSGQGGTGGSGGTAGGISGIAAAVVIALKEVISLRDALSKLTGTIFGQERAVTAYEAAWDAAQKSLKENKKTLSIYTEKGRENRAALVNLAEAAHEVVSAMDDLNKSPDAIYKKMKEQRNEFLRMARAMGLTSAQATKLANSYGLIPSKAKAAAIAEDKAKAFNKAAEKKNAAEEKRVAGKAHGGVTGTGMTLLGEHGPEIVRLPGGSTVLPAGVTRNMLSSGGGGGVVVLEINSGGSKLDDLLLEILRKAVRSRGGNVQLVVGKS